MADAVISKQDIVSRSHSVLLELLAIAVVLTVIFSPTPFFFTLYFLALPSIYLVYRRRSIFLPALAAALLFGLLYGVSFDYIVEVSGEWIFPRSSEFYTPNLYLNVVSGDVLNWFFWWVFLIVAYYESFVDRKNRKYVRGARGKHVAAILFGIAGLVLITALRTKIAIPYSYTVLGAWALVPVIVLAFRRQYDLSRLLKSMPYLMLVFASMEILALLYGYWAFTGEYVGAVSFFGRRLPFEEIVYWILGSAVILISYHELFLDDEH